MPFTMKKTEYVFEVRDEPPMGNVNNPDGEKFRPTLAVVFVYDDGNVRVNVTGPLLNGRGKEYKTKTGMAIFHEDDVTEPDTPEWVRELLTQVG